MTQATITPTPAEGQGKPLCGAKTVNGTACRRPAGWGTPHPGTGRCKKHLGSTRPHVIKGARDQANEVLRQALHDPNAAPVTDPIQALQRLAGVVANAVEVMGGWVNELDRRIRYDGIAGGEQLRAEVAVWERLIARSESLLTGMARLGIEERVTRLKEAEVALLAGGLRWFMEQQGLAGDVVAEERLTVMLERLDRGELA